MVERKKKINLNYTLFTQKCERSIVFWWNVVCCSVYLEQKYMNLPKSSKSKKPVLWTKKKKQLIILFRSLKALNFIHLCPVWKTSLYKTLTRMQLMEMCSGRQEQDGQWLHLGHCEPPHPYLPHSPNILPQSPHWSCELNKLCTSHPSPNIYEKPALGRTFY